MKPNFQFEFQTDEDGIPHPRDEVIKTTSQALEDYLLETYSNPGKDPRSLIISESKTQRGNIPGLHVVTADGKKTFHSYSGGAGSGEGFCSACIPVKLRVGWAVWLSEKLMGSGELNVRIFLTLKEVRAYIVLRGLTPG